MPFIHEDAEAQGNAHSQGHAFGEGQSQGLDPESLSLELVVLSTMWFHVHQDY